MKAIIATVCTADHFQWYIPMFLWTWYHAYPEEIERVEVHLMGKLEESIWDVLRGHEFKVPYLIREERYADFSVQVSTANTLRWTDLEPTRSADGDVPVLIVDVDTLHFTCNTSIFGYFDSLRQSRETIYGGYHGPWQKPERPEVCPNGWQGPYERVAGGFFMVWPQWWAKTKEARRRYSGLLRDGQIGGYRESDEVTLCHIIKDSGLPVPKEKFFPLELRGIHLGDFKPSMSHRFTSPKKMAGKVHVRSLREYVRLRERKYWNSIREVCCQSSEVAQVLKNLDQYVESQGLFD
jgi:hypothetical protein